MSMADMIPSLADNALKTLLQNAERLAAGAPGPQQVKAEELIPLITAEMAIRKPPKPEKVVKVKAAAKAPAKPRAKKAKAVEAEDAEA